MTTASISESKTLNPSLSDVVLHYLPITIFPLILAAATFGGWWLVLPCLFFAAVGPLDLAFGIDERNMDPKSTSESQLFAYSVPVWLWAILWPTTLIYSLWQIFVVGNLAVWESVLLALILATEGQGLFIAGHELVHRRSAWERYVGEFVLASGSYAHYATEHFYIHHAYVGTPIDSGSPPKGQSFWHYFPREILHNFTGAWKMAQKRMRRRNLSVWHYSNPFWRYGIETAAWYALIFILGGWLAVIIYIVLCLFVLMSMKISNYLQHYGLRRIRLPNGRFEKVGPQHSWSTCYKFSKWMFFNSQRHADHHIIASRNYPLLQHYDENTSPQLPASYASLIFLVLNPKRWFKTMDPLVDEWRAKFYPEIKDWSAYDSEVAAKRPEAFEAIVSIFQFAPRLATFIERSPELLDSLLSREFTDLDIPGGFSSDPEFEAIARRGLVRVYWTHEFDIVEMKERLIDMPAQDAADAAENARNWANNKTFQVSMHVLRQNLTPRESSIALSNIAEASIATVITATIEDEQDRYYQEMEGGFAVFALCDLSTKEVAPKHSIELRVIHDGPQSEDHASLCQRFRDALKILANDSLLFDPISNSRKQVVDYSLNDLQSRLESEDSEGESIKVAMARCIYSSGDAATLAKIFEAQRDVLSGIDIESQFTAQNSSDIGAEDAVNLPLADAAVWGLTRIESAARRLCWTLSAKYSGDLNLNDATSTFQEANRHSIIADDTIERLVEVAELWHNLHGILNLVLKDDTSVEDLTDDVKLVLAQACNLSDFDELQDEVCRAATDTENCVIEILEKSE